MRTGRTTGGSLTSISKSLNEGPDDGGFLEQSRHVEELIGKQWR